MINSENKSRIFLVIIAILVITNIGLLIFFLQKEEMPSQSYRQDRKAYITNFLQKEIGFDQQQLSTYDTLSNRHREKASRVYEDIRNNKTIQFKKLVSLDFSDSAINAVVDQSVTLQKTLDINLFNHVKSIRLLCTPAQLPIFDSVFIKVFNWKREIKKKS